MDQVKSSFSPVTRECMNNKLHKPPKSFDQGNNWNPCVKTQCPSDRRKLIKHAYSHLKADLGDDGCIEKEVEYRNVFLEPFLC